MMSLTRSRTDPQSFLDQFPEEQKSRKWMSISNLDDFFANVYKYHFEGGFWPILLSRISSILTIAFTIFFSTFLIAFVNWSLVLNYKCDGNGNCRSIIENRLNYGLFGTIVITCVVIFTCYLIWISTSFIFFEFPQLRKTRHFFRYQLSITQVYIHVFSYILLCLKYIFFSKKCDS